MEGCKIIRQFLKFIVAGCGQMLVFTIRLDSSESFVLVEVLKHCKIKLTLK